MKAGLERSLLVLFSAVLGLALFEVFLRVQEPHLHLMKERAEWSRGRYEAHPVWHHWLRPNRVTSIRSLSPAINPAPIVFQVNAMGCRDSRDLSAPPPAGTKRIVVMGDSFTEGYYPEDGFAMTLERRLDAGGRDHQVINCGTASYSPMLHYLRYTHRLRETQPDEVIVNLDLTDVFDDNWRYRPQAEFGENGEPLAAGSPLLSWARLADALRFRFYTARLLLGNPRDPLFGDIDPRELPTAENIFAYHREPPGSAAWEHDVAFTIGLLDRLVDAIRESGARPIITTYPYRQQYEAIASPEPWNRAFEERVARFAAHKGVAFYSAYDDLRPLFEQGVPLYWQNDYHFTPIGQQAWSEAFAAYYVRELAGR